MKKNTIPFLNIVLILLSKTIPIGKSLTIFFSDEFLDLSKQELINSVESDITNETQEIAKNISVSFVKPITTKILSMIVSTIIVIVLIVIVGIIARQFNKIINKTVIGGANKALGGILGLIKGVAASTVFCLIISTILHLTKNGFWIINI